MGDVPPENIQTKSSSEKIPIHFVYANPSQPRKNFNQELLKLENAELKPIIFLYFMTTWISKLAK